MPKFNITAHYTLAGDIEAASEEEARKRFLDLGLAQSIMEWLESTTLEENQIGYVDFHIVSAMEY